MSNLVDIICDPYDGPFEGEDFIVDEHNNIVVNNNDIKTASLIIRKVNLSKIYKQNLVKIAQSGDTIILGFDNVANNEIIYSDEIGPNKEVLAQVRQDLNGKFYLYLNNKRNTRTFKNLTAVKKSLKKLHDELQQVAVVEEFEED